ncbi:MAG: dihydropyrimidinase [Pseudomonadota bacterium]
MATIIQHGEIITASDRYHADLRIEDGVITLIGQGLPVGPGDEVIDAAGRWVIPGGVDVHTHLDMPFMGTMSSDDFFTGTRAAAFGGTTSIVDFAVSSRGKDYEQVLDTWMAKAEGKAVFDYGLHMCMTWYDTEQARAGVRACVDRGVSSFKTFMAYKGALGVEDPELFAFMRDAGEWGVPVSMHAENGSIVESMQQAAVAAGHLTPEWHALTRPSGVEGEATASAIALARYAGCKLYIVHLTCQEALDAVREARRRGQEVYAETCPQYLMFDDEVYRRPDFEGAKWVMSPPIRPKGHQDYLWAGLKDGSLQSVATDHCPFFFETQKQMGRENFTKIPNGAPGIGDRMAVMYTYGVLTGRLDVHRWIELCCTFPARFFHLYPRKGTIAVGADADIVVFDPAAHYTMGMAHSQHRCDYNAYEGMAGRGAFDLVMSRGRVLWDHGAWKGEAGMGGYLHRTAGQAPRLVGG